MNLFNASVVYSNQLGHGGWISRLLSDWQIAQLMRYETGFPINPLSGLDNSLTGVGEDRPNVVPNESLYTYSGHSSHLCQWVNPLLYTENALGTYGDAAHNSLRTPGYFDVNAALSRNFEVSERVHHPSACRSFNVSNHPNFGGPTPSTGILLGQNAAVSSSQFGKITTAGDPRILQGAMKLIF
jgi:hypothetical protein